MTNNTIVEPIDILLVEDNPGDVRLTTEALKKCKIHNNLFVVKDGVEAMSFLHKEAKYADAVTPDIIFLDLNLPKKDGREVLEEIKADENLKKTPVVILTTSQNEEDILKAYDLHANCFITKPVGFEQFTKIVAAIDNFWFSIVKLPGKNYG